MLRARSIAEEHLYIRLHPCASCGRAVDLGSLAHATAIVDAGELISIFSGKCSKCGNPLRYELVLATNAPGPSEIIDPAEYMMEAESLAGRGEPARAIACFEEVAKFIPAGARSVPSAAFRSERSVAYRETHADLFTRDHLEARIAALRAVTPVAARSEDELYFFLEEIACPSCGEHELDPIKTGIKQGVFSGPCKRCGTERHVRFVSPIAASAPAFALAAGTEPSKLFTADQLRAIATRELALAREDPTSYATLGEYESARRRVIRARTALTEAAKFRREVVSLDEARAAATWERYKAAQAAIEAKPGAMPEARGLNERFAQHRMWLARGRVGDGQLRMSGEAWDGLRMQTGDFRYALLEHARLERMDLSFARLGHAKLRESKLLGCALAYATLDQTELEATDLAGSSLSLATLVGTRVHGGDWSTLRASRSEWRDARLEGVDLHEADLSDSILEGVTFTRCDLRDVDLRHVDAQFPNLGIVRDTRFVDCDLRGARLDGVRLAGVRFEQCQLDGVFGTPEITNVTIDGAPWTR